MSNNNTLPFDVALLRHYGCNDAADKAMDTYVRMRIRSIVCQLASEWRSGCRGEYAAQFDAIAKAIYEKEFGGADKPTGREAVAQVKPQESSNGHVATAKASQSIHASSRQLDAGFSGADHADKPAQQANALGREVANGQQAKRGGLAGRPNSGVTSGRR